MIKNSRINNALFKLPYELLTEICTNASLVELFELRQINGVFKRVATIEIFSRKTKEAYQYQKHLLSEWILGRWPIFVNNTCLKKNDWSAAFDMSYYSSDIDFMHRALLFSARQLIEVPQEVIQSRQYYFINTLIDMLKNPNRMIQQYNAGNKKLLESVIYALNRMLPYIKLNDPILLEIDLLAQFLALSGVSIRIMAVQLLSVLPSHYRLSCFCQQIIKKIEHSSDGDFEYALCHFLKTAVKKEPDLGELITEELAIYFSQEDFHFSLLSNLPASLIRKNWLAVASAVYMQLIAQREIKEATKAYIALEQHATLLPSDRLAYFYDLLSKQFEEFSLDINTPMHTINLCIFYNCSILPNFFSQLLFTHLNFLERMHEGLGDGGALYSNYLLQYVALSQSVVHIVNSSQRSLVIHSLVKLFLDFNPDLSHDLQFYSIQKMTESLVYCLPVMTVKNKQYFQKAIEVKLNIDTANKVHLASGVMAGLMQLDVAKVLTILSDLKVNSVCLDGFNSSETVRLMTSFLNYVYIADKINQGNTNFFKDEQLISMLTTELHSDNLSAAYIILDYIMTSYLDLMRQQTSANDAVHQYIQDNLFIKQMLFALTHDQVVLRQKALNFLMILVPKLSNDQKEQVEKLTLDTFEVGALKDFIALQYDYSFAVATDTVGLQASSVNHFQP